MLKAWCKVLPDRVYKRAMGALLSLVTGKICTPVMGAQDLAEEQTHALHRIFKTLGEAVRHDPIYVSCCYRFRPQLRGRVCDFLVGNMSRGIGNTTVWLCVCAYVQRVGYVTPPMRAHLQG